MFGNVYIVQLSEVSDQLADRLTGTSHVTHADLPSVLL
jgi:hypothetical protein